MTHELYRITEDIENWLNKYQVTNYELIKNNEYGYLVNVNSYVYLNKKNLEEIKVKFNIIHGSFNCSYNKLTTLKGCPEIINGNFICKYNKLQTLENCPKIINGDFICSHNKLNSLEYFPKKINETCYFYNNPELGEIQNIHNFEELKKTHESIILKKKLEKEIIIAQEKMTNNNFKI